MMQLVVVVGRGEHCTPRMCWQARIRAGWTAGKRLRSAVAETHGKRHYVLGVGGCGAHLILIGGVLFDIGMKELSI